jgi:excisionase family DNA binding protein
MSERLLSVDDIADLTGWTPGTIYKKAQRGRIPGRCKLDGSLRFKQSSVDSWLENLGRQNEPIATSSHETSTGEKLSLL